MKPLSAAPPRQRARSATAERESYQAIFLEENRRKPMKPRSPAPPRQPARSATRDPQAFGFWATGKWFPLGTLRLPPWDPQAFGLWATEKWSPLGSSGFRASGH